MQQDIATCVQRKQDDVRKFVAETHKPDAVAWPFAIGGMIVGAAMFGAGATFMKLLGA